MILIKKVWPEKVLQNGWQTAVCRVMDRTPYIEIKCYRFLEAKNLLSS